MWIDRRVGRRSGNPRAASVLTTFVLAAAVALGCLLVAGCSGDSDDAAIRDAGGEPDEWNDPGGRWHEGGWKEATADGATEITGLQRAAFEKLRSIGYLSGSTPAPTDVGVVVYESAHTYDGLNFYTSGDFPGAILMDMTGNTIHKWHFKYVDVWKEHPGTPLPRSNKTAGYWRRARLFENGDVLAIFEGLGIIRVDLASDLVWSNLNGAHHDLDVANDGSIFVLTREPRIVPRIHTELPILEDAITVLDPEGNELRSISLLEAFENSDYAHVLEGMKESGDVFHTNTIEILDGTLEDRLPPFREGNLLVCLRELDVIAVVDPEQELVVWSLTANWKAPHQPTVLPSGNLLLFDNKGYRGMSRVVEFDPVTLEPMWVYQGDPPNSFFSRECGSNQRLPNGNTLITESDRGKAFEVTPEGNVVWKYFNPAQGGDEGQFIATLFEVVRLGPDFPLDWMRVVPGR